MGRREIQNKRIDDGNVSYNAPANKAHLEGRFYLSPHVVQSLEDKHAVVSALEMFISVCDDGIHLPGRELTEDQSKVDFARRVLARLR